ncbi:MAG TPA: glycerophosphodiester phosphodiesterase family protein [Candidatus Limnocylindrales bacterium]|nr:glycerophosphodiester phosphodiesterase family protein [Candidatus Limnocylindrales bacterium]
MAPPSPFRRIVTGKVSIVAHRGLSAEAPENTMAAFRLAVDAGCDLIEFDVHQTKDDQLVVIHDDTLDRTTTGSGFVRDHTLAQIQRLETKGSTAHPAERVPTLDEVLGWGRTSGVALSVEIKQPAPLTGRPPYPKIAERVTDLVTAHDMATRVLVHSFDHPTVKQLRRLLPHLATAISYGGGTFIDPLVLGRAADASGIHAWWTWLSADVIKVAHEARMHVHGWGLPDPPDPDAIALLVRAGVDTMDTSDPRVLRPILAALG